jgi:hypothetical protein
MTGIRLKPDLRTSGGEVSSIVLKDKFVGLLTLVYRESDRLSGSIQLEKQSLSASDKQDVLAFMQSYVQQVTDALQARQCEVVVTYSSYDDVIGTDHYEGEDLDFDWEHDEVHLEDIDPRGKDELEMNEPEVLGKNTLGYKLVIVEEKRNTMEYHIYDPNDELIAEANLHINGNDVAGDIYWRSYPFEEEMDEAVELIVSDFNEEEIDIFQFNMVFDGEVLDTVEWMHQDLIDEALEESLPVNTTSSNRADYTVVLARDDGDTLTYEIYQQSYGGLPIGTATIDISERSITGFIDFREAGEPDDREWIAMLLLEELDKEKEYEAAHLSMLHHNQLIDEMSFEMDRLH